LQTFDDACSIRNMYHFEDFELPHLCCCMAHVVLWLECLVASPALNCHWQNAQLPVCLSGWSTLLVCMMVLHPSEHAIVA
jgi:hypothetical protein